ncbi:MAG: LuxR C-terminal-related transcriptional regulator [Pseudomonadota bacterium]
MEHLKRLEQELETTQTEAKLKKVFSTIIKAMGYHGFDAYCLRSRIDDDPDYPGNFFLNDYGLELPWSYLDDGWIKSDPTLVEISLRSQPFEYLDFLRKVQKNSSVKWQLGALALQNVKQAWCVPLNVTGAIRGMTVYMRGNGEDRTRIFRETGSEIQLMCSTFIDRASRLQSNTENSEDQNNHRSDTPIEITMREADCLRLAARGNTNSEIAQLLSVSENTVRFHLKNIFRKLGVTTRANAVSIGLKSGIIEN